MYSVYIYIFESRWISSIVSCWTAGVGVQTSGFVFGFVFVAQKKNQRRKPVGFFLIQLKNGPRLRPLYQCRFFSKQLHDEIVDISSGRCQKKNFDGFFDAP